MNLIKFVIKGDLIGIQEAVKSGEDINQRDRDQRTALMHATIAKYETAVAHLLRSGADPNIRDFNGWTALHFAAQEYVAPIMKLLLDYGAVVDCPDENGNTPSLMLSLIPEDEVKLLLCSYGPGQTKIC